MAGHIHTPGDGRNPRKIFVNGYQVPHPVYADTKKGEVWHYPLPIRLNKRKDAVYSRRLKGVVTVEEIYDNNNSRG